MFKCQQDLEKILHILYQMFVVGGSWCNIELIKFRNNPQPNLDPGFIINELISNSGGLVPWQRHTLCEYFGYICVPPKLSLFKEYFLQEVNIRKHHLSCEKYYGFEFNV